MATCATTIKEAHSWSISARRNNPFSKFSRPCYLLRPVHLHERGWRVTCETKLGYCVGVGYNLTYGLWRGSRKDHFTFGKRNRMFFHGYFELVACMVKYRTTAAP